MPRVCLQFVIVALIMCVPLLGFSLCKTNETFRNEMTCNIPTKPWFIYRIKKLYDRVVLSELA